MINDDITENVLQCGKEGVKQNIMEALDEFCDEYADEMYRAVEEIIRLRAENAALRKQISEMIMPPCTLGDTLYIVACTFGDGYVEDEIVHQSGFSVVKSVVTEKNFYKMCDLVRNGKAFFSREAAERELEELGGKCKCEFERKSKFDREFERGVRRGEELFRKANGIEEK